MSMRFHSSVLMVRDIKVMTKFYHESCGLAIENDFGACIGFADGLSIWEIPPTHPICKTVQAMRNKTGTNQALELCFETEQFEEAVAKIKESGVELLHDIIEENWGQYTIRFYDPEGNLVELGESIAGFVARMHREGMDIEQIVQKTGVPKGQVEAILGFMD